jgi:hypothetical protein
MPEEAILKLLFNSARYFYTEHLFQGDPQNFHAKIKLDDFFLNPLVEAWSTT